MEQRRPTTAVSAAVLVALVFAASATLTAQRRRFFSEEAREPTSSAAIRAGSSGVSVVRSRTARADLARLTAIDRSSGLPVESATSLDLNLFDDARFIAQLEKVDDLGAGRFSWLGNLIGVPEGRVTFTVADGVLAGSVTTSTAAYAIRWKPGDVYEIQQVSRDGFQREAQPLRVPRTARTAGNEPPESRHDDGSAFDLLVWYSTDAKNAAGSASAVNALIALGVSETNQAYANIGMASQLRLVGTAEWTQTETAVASSQLTAFRSSSPVAAQRNALGADMVMLVVNRLSDACGIGYQLVSSATAADLAPFAYTVVRNSCISPNYTFAHELGHNMGSDHAPDDNATDGAFPYSSGYKDPAGGFRTVMAYECSPSCRRLLTFSSPSNVFNGRTTGRTTQDNARSLKNTATIVANYRASVLGALPAAPGGLTVATSGSSVTLQWTAPSGTAATSYTIEAGSASGLANLASFSTGSTATSYSTSGVAAGVYYVRVRAANLAGSSGVSNEVVAAVGGACAAAPDAPGGLRIVSVSGGTVMVAWSAPSGVPTTYLVEAGSSPGLSNLANVDLASTATTLTAPGVARGTYHVRIRARNTCGTSGPSNDIVIVI